MTRGKAPRWIFVALFLVAVVAAGLYLPMGTWWSALRTAVSPDVQSLQATVDEERAAAAQISHLKALLKTVHPGSVGLPQTADSIGFLTEVSQDAAAAGVQVPSTSFGAAMVQGNVMAVPVTLQVSGSPGGTAAFIQALEGGPRLVVVQNLSAGPQASRVNLLLYYR